MTEPRRARRGRRAILAATLAGALGVSPAGFAAAPEPTSLPSDRGAFDALVEEARVAREEGRLDDALAALRHAYALSHSPAVLNNVGVLLEELGRYDEALAAARELADHPELPSDRRPGVDARVAALEDKAGAAWLRLRLDPGATATVLHEVVPGDRELRREPGRARVTVRDPGRAVAVQTDVRLIRGRRLDLDLTEAACRERLGAYDVADLGGPALQMGRARWSLAGPDAVRRIYVDPGDHRLSLPGGGERTLSVAGGEVLALVPGAPDAGSYIPYLLVGGAGLVSAGVGAGLLVDAGAQRDDLRAALGSEPVDGLGREAALARERDADDQATSGAVLVGAGAVAITAALVWWAVSDETPTIAVRGTSAAWTVRF